MSGITERIDEAKVRVGQLFVDLEQLRPLQTAALLLNPGDAPLILVPYMDHVPQFEDVARWFRSRNPPRSLLFVDTKGAVTLTGVRWQGTSSSGLHARGKMTADVAVMGVPSTMAPEFRVEQFMSRIDGLDEFAGFHPVELSEEALGRGDVHVAVDDSERVECRFGDFTYSINSAAPWESIGSRTFSVSSAPFIQTLSEAGARPEDHLAAHWAIRALLILLHGKPLAWREHKLCDRQFGSRPGSAEERGLEYVDVIMSGTAGDFAASAPKPHSLSFPAATLTDLGAEGLRKWIELYADDNFRRAVDPAVEVINGATRFLEPQVMMLAISLDRFGAFRYGDRKRRALEIHILKCLRDCGLQWPSIGRPAAIANAIAKINNDLKHPDRNSYPEGAQLRCLRDLARLIVRAQVLDVCGTSTVLRDALLQSAESRDVIWLFNELHMRLDSSGNFSASS